VLLSQSGRDILRIEESSEDKMDISISELESHRIRNAIGDGKGENA